MSEPGAGPVFGDFTLLGAPVPDDVYEGPIVRGMSRNGQVMVLSWHDPRSYWALGAWDRAAGTLTPISVTAAGRWAAWGGDFRDITPDGRYVVFNSRGSLVPEDTNHRRDVYRRDLVTGTTVRVSVTSKEQQVHGGGFAGAVSDDGDRVVFISRAPALTGTRPLVRHVFVRDIAAGTTRLVSRNSRGEVADAGCNHATVSGSGDVVAFESTATNLGADGDADAQDVFVKDLATGQVQVGTMDPTLTNSQDAGLEGVSADGTRLVFEIGFATERTYVWKPYLRDLVSGGLAPLAVDPTGTNRTAWASLLGDENWVVVSSRRDLTGSEGEGAAVDFDTYLLELASDQLYRITGPQEPTEPPELQRGTNFGYLSVPADRSFMVFSTLESLVPEDDDGGRLTAYIRTLDWSGVLRSPS